MLNLLFDMVPNLVNGLSGGLAGAATKAFEDATGIKLSVDKNPEKEIEKIIAEADPELLLKIKEADQKFKVTMETLNVDVKKLNVENTKDARDMYKITKDKMVPFLAWFILIFAFGLLAALFFIDIPPANRDLINTYFSLIIGYAGCVVTFYFGSSKSSGDKNKLLSQK